MQKEVILTGLRSNSEFHLGNYLGAILPMVEMQKKHAGQYQLNMFIPDLHSFTTPIDHNNLYSQTIQNLKFFVASGLNIEQPDTFIYRQSYIPAHSELTWILSCFVSYGELGRMTQFKDRIESIAGSQMADAMTESDEEMKKNGWNKERIERARAVSTASYMRSLGISAGLFFYPVLMVADILLYGAKWVPVGEDQRQHVEFAREIANRMNNKFYNLFVMPEDNAKQTEFVGRMEPIRVRSLRNPDKKMSKSVEDPAGTIMLSDKPNEAAEKISAATTDSAGVINYNWEKQPGITNLLQILALLSEKTQEEINGQWSGKTSYDELKAETAKVVKASLSDIQSNLAAVDESKLMQKLESDERATAEVAGATLLKVQQAVGLRPKT